MNNFVTSAAPGGGKKDGGGAGDGRAAPGGGKKDVPKEKGRTRRPNIKFTQL